MLNNAGQNEELAAMIDWKEALKTGLEMTGFDNPDKFFKSEEESQIDQAANFIKQLPEDLQSAVMQNVQPILEQVQMILQQGEQNGNQNITPMGESEQAQPTQAEFGGVPAGANM